MHVLYPNVWHTSFTVAKAHLHALAAWLIHMCDMTHSCVWNDAFMCVTWCIHMCDITHSYVCHDSFMCDMTHACVWHDIFTCMTHSVWMWYTVETRDMPYSRRDKVWYTVETRDTPYSRRDKVWYTVPMCTICDIPLKHVTRLILGETKCGIPYPCVRYVTYRTHMFNTPQWNAWHDLF